MEDSDIENDIEHNETILSIGSIERNIKIKRINKILDLLMERELVVEGNLIRLNERVVTIHILHMIELICIAIMFLVIIFK
jgi:hypothetical protein